MIIVELGSSRNEYHETVADIKRLAQLFPAVMEIAYHSATMDEAIDGILKYLNSHNTHAFRVGELQKSRKKDYLKHLGGDPKAAEVVDWTVQNTPNRNWSDWVIRNYKKDPSSLTGEVKESIKHFNSMVHLPHVNNFRFDPSHDFSSGISGLKDAETKSLAAQKDKRPAVSQKGKKIMDLGNGWAWWNLGEPSCREEGGAMGHCGNEGSPHDEDRVISLRQEAGPGKFLPHVTAIFNNGFLGEIKGPNNSKPSEKHHKAILELLKHKKIRGVVGAGYKPENNFQHHDLSEEDYEGLLKIKPRIFSPDISELPEKWEDEESLPPEITDRAFMDRTEAKAKAEGQREAMNLLLDPNLTSDQLDELASERGDEIYTIAENRNAPPEVLAKLANSGLVFIASAALRNPNTPPEALAKLANSPNPYYVEAVAKHPNTPPEVLAKLANSANPNTVMWVAVHRNTPPEALAELASRDSIAFNRRIAKNPNTPPEVLAKLATGDDPWTQAPAIVNPNMPIDVLVRLADSHDHNIVAYVAKNPKTPPEVLAKLADFGNTTVEASVASNPNTPSEVLVKLSNGVNYDDALTLFELAQNPNTPPEALKKLENHKNASIRFEVFNRIPRRPKEYSQWERLAHKPNPSSDEIDAAEAASAQRGNAARRILLTETLGPNAKERDLEIYKYSHDKDVREAAHKEIKRRSTINKSDALRKSRKKDVDPTKTPRQQATDNTKESLAGPEYRYARKSKFKNQGEDIAKSARHKFYEYHGIEHAEESGHAEQIVKLKNLLKYSPPNIMVEDRHDKPLINLAAHYVLSKFPKAPAIPNYLLAPDDNTTVVSEYEHNGRRQYVNPAIAQPPEGATLIKNWTSGEIKKKARLVYTKAYEHMKNSVESVVNEHSAPDHYNVISKARAAMHNYIHDLRSGKITGDESLMNASMSNMFIDYHNNTLGARRKGSVGHNVNDFIDKFKNKYATAPTSPDQATRAKLAKHISDVISGESHEDTFGLEKVAGPKKDKFSLASLYAGSAERNGPSYSDLKNSDDHVKYLINTAKIRGLQYGNTVTDKEREHHLKHAAHAMRDLSEILQLPHEMISFNGRLGFSIGARGFGNATAHYEPDLRTINLTRKGGVGSLSHEWGHFFDNILPQVMYGDKYAKLFGSEVFGTSDHMYRTLPDKEKIAPLHQSLAKIAEELNSGLRSRIQRDYYGNPDNYKGITPSALRSYWLSYKEMFARAFEGYVKKKLAQAGRRNTYLTNAADHPLWPSKEESDRLAPMFDSLFDVFRRSTYLKKSLMSILKSMRKDILPGGLADKKTAKDFNPKQLSSGMKVESEHTDNKDMAREIAMDHLTEDPNYYIKLKRMEKSDNPHDDPWEAAKEARNKIDHDPMEDLWSDWWYLNHEKTKLLVRHYNTQKQKEHEKKRKLRLVKAEAAPKRADDPDHLEYKGIQDKIVSQLSPVIGGYLSAGTTSSQIPSASSDTNLYRAYKNTPHKPLSVGLKYLVHRIENVPLYDNTESGAEADKEFLSRVQSGKAAEKNGHLEAKDLHLFVNNNSHLIPQLLRRRKAIHEYLTNYGLTTDINGTPHVALTRGLNANRDERLPDHALASYADVAETGFGNFMHHQWVPVGNVWYSYDIGPEEPSGNAGPENEWLISPHKIKESKRSDIKKLALERHHSTYMGADGVALLKKNRGLPLLKEDYLALAGKHPSMVASDDGAPPEVLAKLADHSNLGIAYSVALNHNTPPEILAKLADHGNIDVIRGVAQNRNTPPEALAKLANGADLRVVESAASNPNTPPETLAKLANHSDMLDAVRNVASNPNTPPEVLAKLANHDDIRAVERVAYNKNAPLNTLVKLANSNNSKVASNVAINPGATPEILAKLANSGDRVVTTGAASNPNTPPEVLAKLANHSDNNIVYTVGKNPNTPPAVLAKLASRSSFVGAAIGVASNPNTPPWVLAKLASSDSETVIRGVSDNPNTPPEVLAKLANHRNADVVFGVARNPNTSSEVLIRLANHKQDFIARTAVKNPNYPKEGEAASHLEAVNKSEQKPREIASIAVIDGDHLLMGVRNDTKKYTLPGGHINKNESPVAGAVRELWEEAGIGVDPKKLIHLTTEQTSDYYGRPIIVHAYVLFGKYGTNTHNDPDKEVDSWYYVDVSGGLPEKISKMLHSPKNVTLKAIGLQDEQGYGKAKTNKR